MQSKLTELKQFLAEIDDLENALAVLGWDQATYMPKGGAPARGRQMATLARISHGKFTDPGIGKLLDSLMQYAETLPPDSDDASLIRIAKREYDRAIQIPTNFMEAYTKHCAKAYQVWTEARPANDFASMHDLLEVTLEYRRKLANYFPGYESIADPLIGFADFGVKTSDLKVLFDDLRNFLVPLVNKITEVPQIDDSCLYGYFPAQKQLSFGVKVIKKMGYDFQRGRQDLTHHPFMTKFSLGDVRITTRVQDNFLVDALFSTLHEAGHAMYEQGIRSDLEGSFLAHGASAGVHESQSRLWENIVGRSREFWDYFYGDLQKTFPEALDTVSDEEFYKAINKVEKSFIRVDADEVTYNLHVMLRFDLELGLLEGTINVKDLPEIWNSRFESDFGITPEEDRLGVLQDVHWYGGSIGGAFQGYTLGNIMCAQFYQQALTEFPEIPLQIKSGNFKVLHNWMIENIYQHGRKFTAGELLNRVTGKSLTIGPYKEYLSSKYRDIYSIP